MVFGRPLRASKMVKPPRKPNPGHSTTPRTMLSSLSLAVRRALTMTSNISIVVSEASTAQVAGASSTTVNAATTYTVTLKDNNGNTIVAQQQYTITPASAGAIFSPAAPTITIGSTGVSFTATWATSGAKTLSITSAPSLIYSPPSISVTVNELVLPAVTGKYRYEQEYLFYKLPNPPTKPSEFGGAAWNFDRWTPNYKYVDRMACWRWTNQFGDWLGLGGVPQGTTPMSSWVANLASGSTAVWTYTVDVTVALQYVQTNNRWAAFHMRQPVTTQVRAVASMWHATYAAPSIFVTYSDGTTATLTARTMAAMDSSTSLSTATRDVMNLPVVIEFDRPTKAITSATMTITVTKHNSTSNPTIWFNPLDPPLGIQADSGYGGLASQTGLLDLGIESVPGVLGAQRYVDGKTLDDFAVVGSFNYYDSTPFSPHLWNGGPIDTNKVPYTHINKWRNVNPAGAPGGNPITYVDSAYTGEGFKPLRPGLGALRARMIDEQYAHGQTNNYGGTGAANAVLYLPEPEFGLCNRIFVRKYIRFGTPFVPTVDDRYEILQSGTNPDWIDMGGKWAPTPAHLCMPGPNSSGSGGGYCWQMRLSWTECETVTGSPQDRAWHIGFHLFDWGNRNPPGYQYGDEGHTEGEAWGRGGALGCQIYPGRWYCIETEMLMNDVDQPSGTGDGKFWTPNGELRAWVDGRLVYERTGMVFRTLPRYEGVDRNQYLGSVRDLGVTGLWWNWYHGGLTPSSYERIMFHTGLVWAKQRIGRMNGADYPETVDLPKMPPTTSGDLTNFANTIGLASSPSNRWINTGIVPGMSWAERSMIEGAKDATQAEVEPGPADVGNFTAPANDTLVNSNGAAWFPTLKRFYWFGGGHGGYPGNEVYWTDLPSMTWGRINDPSPMERWPAGPSGWGWRTTDGTPISYHTYNGIVAVESQNCFYTLFGSPWPDGNFPFSEIWRFNIVTKVWTKMIDDAFQPAVDEFRGPEAHWIPSLQKIAIGQPNYWRLYDPFTNTLGPILGSTSTMSNGNSVATPTTIYTFGSSLSVFQILISQIGVTRPTVMNATTHPRIFGHARAADALFQWNSFLWDASRNMVISWSGSYNSEPTTNRTNVGKFVYAIDFANDHLYEFVVSGGSWPTSESLGSYTKWQHLTDLDCYIGLNNRAINNGWMVFKPGSLTLLA